MFYEYFLVQRAEWQLPLVLILLQKSNSVLLIKNIKSDSITYADKLFSG